MVAAKHVFAEKGFNKSTMEDIATEAELSPGTLYLYFKNKDELYASLSLRVLKYLNIRLEQLDTDTSISTNEALTSLKEAMLDVYEFDPLVLINMFHLQSSETLKSLSPDLLENIQNLSDSSIASMTSIYRHLSTTDKNIFGSPSALSDITWSLFSGVVLWEESKKVFNERKDFLRQTLDIAFEILERGMKTSPIPDLP
ncbi:MAG: TetR/AcrR family transcriptional regulator [Pseudomonadota bacterium]